MTPKNECLVPSDMGKSLCVVKTEDLMHDLTHTRQHSATGLHTYHLDGNKWETWATQNSWDCKQTEDIWQGKNKEKRNNPRAYKIDKNKEDHTLKIIFPQNPKKLTSAVSTEGGRFRLRPAVTGACQLRTWIYPAPLCGPNTGLHR